MFPYLDVLGLHIPMYGLMMALAFIAAILVSYFRVRKAGLSTDKLLNIAIISILSGIVGAYVLYMIVTPGFFKELINGISHGDFSVFRDGGFVFYGGLIGGVLAAFIYCKAAKLSFSDYVSVIAPSIPLAHGIGRIGCFCAGCCYGKEIDCAISVIYTHPIGGAPTGVPLFPVQLLETVLNLILFAILLIYARKRMKSLTVMFLYFIMYGIERFSLEFLRADEIRGIFWGLSTSQWISIGMFVIGVVGFIIFTLKDKKKALALATASDGTGASADITDVNLKSESSVSDENNENNVEGNDEETLQSEPQLETQPEEETEEQKETKQ